jgi:hypothetical protein
MREPTISKSKILCSTQWVSVTCQSDVFVMNIISGSNGIIRVFELESLQQIKAIKTQVILQIANAVTVGTA